MKLSDVKRYLKNMSAVNFVLPGGQFVPAHFHVTEVGQIIKNFIDCGGTVRSEKVVNFQLWEANDFEHRLTPQKLSEIIELSERVVKLEDAEIEVEYQAETIGKYGLDFDGSNFLLISKQTNCLAFDKCGIPQEKLEVNLKDLNQQSSCCTPNSGCCN